jgi:hypothetical protein
MFIEAVYKDVSKTAGAKPQPAASASPAAPRGKK